MMTSSSTLVTLSLDGDCKGIKPGDKFIYLGNDEIVVGFTNSEYEPVTPFELIWTITKGKEKIGYFTKDGYAIEKVKALIIKAKVSMTAETAEEEIRKFLNFFND